MYEWFTLVTALCFATVSHIYDPRWPPTATAVDILTNNATFKVAGLDLMSDSLTNKVVANATMLVPFLYLVDPSFERPEPSATWIRLPPDPPFYNLRALFLFFCIAILVPTLLWAAFLLAEKAAPQFMAAFDELCTEVFPGFVNDAPEMHTLSCEKLLKLIEGLEHFRGLAAKHASQRDDARSTITMKDAELDQLRQGLQERIRERDEAMAALTSRELSKTDTSEIGTQTDAESHPTPPEPTTMPPVLPPPIGVDTDSSLPEATEGNTAEPPAPEEKKKKKRKRRHRKRKPKDGSVRNPDDQESQEGGDDDGADDEDEATAGPSGQGIGKDE